MVGEKRQRFTTKYIFEKKHYKSIINLLIEFQNEEFQGKEGLMPVQFRYALEQNYRKPNPTFCPICKKKYPNEKSKYCPECHTELDIDPRIRSNIKQLKTFFGDRLDFLIINDLIIPECVTSKQNLTKFLNNLKNPPIRAIEKIGSNADVRYRLKSDLVKEGIRIQNKETLDHFSRDFIIDFPVNLKSSRAKHILYGLSKDQYNKLDIEKKKKIKENLKEIEKNIEKIEKILRHVSTHDLDNRVGDLLKSTHSEKIKKAMNERSLVIWFRIYDALVINSGVWPPAFLYNIESAKKISKSGFFISFDWIFDVQGVEDYTNKVKNQFCFPIPLPYKDDIDYFLSQLFYHDLGNLSDDEIKKYCKAWSKKFFHKDYDFSKEDIEEILEWCWINKDHFFMFPRIPIAFSRIQHYSSNDYQNLSSHSGIIV